MNVHVSKPIVAPCYPECLYTSTPRWYVAWTITVTLADETETIVKEEKFQDESAAREFATQLSK